MQRYYYLIASLPLATKLSPEQYKGVLQLINRNLSDNDRELFYFLLYPSDIKNIVNRIAERRQLPLIYPHILRPGSLGESGITEFEKGKCNTPAFLAEFYEDYGKALDDMGLFEIEKILTQKFYEDVFKQHDKFLTDYFTFERDLKNILILSGSGKSVPDPKRHLLGDLAPYQKTNRLNQENEILKAYPFIDDIINTQHEVNPTNLEEALDKAQLDYIDELTSFSFFDLHALFARFLKYQLHSRWVQDWSEDTVEQRFNTLLDFAMEQFHLPELFINPKKSHHD